MITWLPAQEVLAPNSQIVIQIGISADATYQAVYHYEDGEVLMRLSAYCHSTPSWETLYESGWEEISGAHARWQQLRTDYRVLLTEVGP